MLYESLMINLDDLLLDTENPRFIVPPNASQQNIIEYLVLHEDVIELCHGINKNHNLFAGERIIAIKDNDKYIVLEGNRRVCACKILMNPELLRNVRPASISNLITYDETKANIKNLNVDVMQTRTIAQSSLAAKHIDGIKKWSPISKYKYFANSFDSGKSIDEIEQITGVSKNKIIAGIKDYRKIDYILNLSLWTEKEKEKYLDLHNIKANRVLRLFYSQPKDKNLPRLNDILKITFDNKYNIVYSIAKNQFDKILHIISSAAFIPGFCPEFNGTRSTYEDIIMLMEYLMNNNLLILPNKDINSQNDKTNGNLSTSPEPSNLEVDFDTKSKHPNENIFNTPYASSSDIKNIKTPIAKNSKNYTSKRNVLIPENFQVHCTNIKINNIIQELKLLKLSKYENAIALLLRSLIELSQKYFLSKIQQTEKIHEYHVEDTYKATVQVMLSKNLINIKENSSLNNLRRNLKLFDMLNGYVHYDSILPNKDTLINYFDNLSNYLQICLNQ